METANARKGRVVTTRVQARYWIETAYPLEEAAAMMAGEQSTGTFIRVPGETDELRERYAARVEEIVELGTVEKPSLPGAALPKEHAGKAVRRTAEVALSWPLENMGPSLPNLLATVAGNLFELKPFSGLKLLDVTLPPEFLDSYQGPQFGVEGTRRLTGVRGRPLIGTIIKPSVGMTPEQTAAQVRMLAEAGVDFIKDDELQADGPHCPFDLRLSAVLRTLNEYADKNRQTANVCGQYYRRDRPDAPPPRCGCVRRRNLRDGQHQQRWLACPDKAAASRAGRDSWTSQRLGYVQPFPRHRNEFYRLPEVLAAGGHRPRSCEWPAKQVLRGGRLSDCLGPRMPDADVCRAE